MAQKGFRVVRNRLSEWLEGHVALACVTVVLIGMTPLAALSTSHSALAIAVVAALATVAFTLWLEAAGVQRAGHSADAPTGARGAQRHQTTGLATREPLLAAMHADLASGAVGGTLGIIEFVDFDRLNGFDCDLADRTLTTISDRVTRMTGPRRPVGQVDRARIAIWFGAGSDGDATRAELDAIRYALADSIDHEGRTIIPELRTGSAAHTSADDTPEQLLTRAIASLAIGGGSFGECAPDPEAQARRSFILEQDLRQAVARGQLEMVYQPLIDGVHQRLCGAEALMRWHHPEFGAVPPAEFIPIAEQAGLAQEIGMWAMNVACREARGWRDLYVRGQSVGATADRRRPAQDDRAHARSPPAQPGKAGN